MDRARHKKKRRGVHCPNLITLEINIYTTWPLVKVILMTWPLVIVTSLSVYVPCIATSIYFSYCVILSTVLVILLVARVVLRFTGSKFPSEDFWEIINYSDNRKNQGSTQWEESGWWDKRLLHRVGGWMEDCK